MDKSNTPTATSDEQNPESRPQTPLTPGSPMTSSLYQATATIDDITVTLSNVSRAASPEPPHLLQCCCGRLECAHTRAWQAFKAKLEGRLILSAEVGQALLRKHEAYIRRQEPADTQLDGTDGERLRLRSESDVSERADRLHGRVAELLKENTVLEKRLNAALINNEIAEAASKTTMQELEEARATITRLTTHHARSIGWDTRLNVAVQEKEDFRQERDSERQRAKVAESRATAATEKCAKLHGEIRQLHDELEQQKQHRSELSEEILRDARARLEMIQQSQLGHTIEIEDAEVTKVMESLVADNEALKRDTAELQNLLAEAREDVRLLREEVEETKATVAHIPEDRSRVVSPTSTRHHHNQSWQSSFGADRLAPLSPTFMTPSPRGFHFPSQDCKSKRPRSVGPPARHSFEPLTPDTDHLPLSPTPSEKYPALISPQPTTHVGIELDCESQRQNTPNTPEKPKLQRKPLLLLTQNRAVQTENWLIAQGHSPSPLPSAYSDLLSTPTQDARSEVSSVADGHASTIAALVDRVNTLYNRITQADALTLTNRLKRQHLLGADVAHLSRSTVGGILTEAGNLRHHFRAVLEDDNVLSTCTRKDLRGLLKVFKDLFSELGQLRMTLNDVILDPTIALQVSEAAMNPSKAVDLERGRSQSRGAQGLGGLGWMAPITKLFGGHTPEPKGSDAAEGVRKVGAGGGPALLRPRPRVAPKLSPALAASTTTVNVEFSGAGTGRAVSSTTTVLPGMSGDAPLRARTPGPAPRTSSARAVMGIFAGAPAVRPAEAEAWVVLPRAVPGARRQASSAALGVTVGRAGAKDGQGRLSRHVDAVIDAGASVPAGMDCTTLLERTLRPRGLSDSSIHSTFVQHDGGAGTVRMTGGENSARQGAFPDRQGVLQTLSRQIQSFGVSGAAEELAEGKAAPQGNNGTASAIEVSERVGSPSRYLPKLSLASWAAASAGFDATMTEEFVGSVRDESVFHRAGGRGDGLRTL